VNPSDSAVVCSPSAAEETLRPVANVAPATSSGFVSRVGRGFGALSLGAVVNILWELSVVPVALYVWGRFRFGEWVLLAGLVQFLKITDLGVQTYVVNKLCASFAMGNQDEFRRVFHSALRVQIPLAILVLGGVAGTLRLFPLGRLIGLHTIAGRSFFLVALLLSTELLLGVPMGVVAGVYRATGNLARAAFLGAAQQFVLLVTTVGLIAANSSFVAVATAQVICAIGMSAWIIHDLNQRYPWLGIWPTVGSFRQGWGMVGPGMFFLLIPLADFVGTQLTLVITQRSLGAAEVSRLATHRTVVNFGIMLSALVTTAVWPELSALNAIGNKSGLVRVHRTLAKLNLWMVGGLMLCLLPLIHLLYPLWTARRLSLDSWTLTFMLARLLLWTIWSASATVLLASNKHYRPSFALLIEALLTGGLALYLIPILGIRGAALSALVADVCVCAWFIPRLAIRELGEDLTIFARQSLQALMAIVIPALACALSWHFFGSIVVRYALAFPLCLGVAVFFIFIQLDHDEREILERVLFRIRAAFQV
jgi:O-antigen/teichoic acid export membrane protein